MKTLKYKTLLLTLILFSMCIVSCKKFIEVEPPSTSINEGNVFENEGTAISAVIGIYTEMSGSNLAGIISFYPELSADNLKLLNLTLSTQIGYYQNNLRSSDVESVPSPWRIIYPRIFGCNAAIEGLTKSKTITPALKQNLLGQVYFLRAFLYFYLTNFYGDIPLAITTDYAVNNTLKKSPSSAVYSQIVADLKQAQAMLPEGYLTGDMKATFSAGQAQRVTPNRFAATALLARVYLYQKDYANAEMMASEVIDQSALYSVSIPLDQVFLKNSRETIWALQPISSNANSREAEMFILRPGQPTVNSNTSSFFPAEFMNIFQAGDQRKVSWVNTIMTDGVIYPYPGKYKALNNSAFTEQSILLRLAEQYLIRAEARIQQDRIAEGIADLNVLRDRATDKNEPDINKRLALLSVSLSKAEANNALNYERRVELFAEGAHRWLDLKRTGQVDAIMTLAAPLKGGTWSAYKVLYPIPAAELVNNTSLIQNDGYTN